MRFIPVFIPESLGEWNDCWLPNDTIRLLLTGVDQFGGNNEKGPVIEAYNMYVRNFGEDVARKRFEA